MLHKKISKIAPLFLPQIVPLGYKYLKRKFRRSRPYLNFFTPEKYAITRKNKVVNNIHKGKRCFLLGTGPSINEIDIKLLKNEHKIFLSEFYLHEKYNNINPKYHLFNALGGHPYANREAILKHYKQAEEIINPTVDLIFRYEYDYDFIKKNQLFENRNIYYISYAGSMHHLLKDGLDASKYFYHPAGCAVAGIQLALCMGFNEIYLLGIDLNYQAKKHFYDEKLSKLYQATTDTTLNMRKKIETSLTERVKVQKLGVQVFEHYQIIKNYCKLHSIKIYNCSKSSILDVYPYKNFEELFMEKNEK